MSGNVVLTFQLIVRDPYGNVSRPDTVDVTVKSVNNPPVADAGDDRTIREGAAATLDGGQSFDPDGDPIVGYAWAQVLGPAVTLTAAGSVQASFVAPVGLAGQVLVFKLSVSDGKESSIPSPGLDSGSADAVAVTIVENSPPHANAGPDQRVDEGNVVALNGAGSSDPDGDQLSYQWLQTSGSSVVLDDPTSPTPRFTAGAVSPGGEDLEFQLTVFDNAPWNPKSATAYVIVHLRNANDPPSCRLARPSP